MRSQQGTDRVVPASLLPSLLFSLSDYFLQKMDRNKDGVVTIEEFIESCQKVHAPALHICLVWTQDLIQ